MKIRVFKAMVLMVSAILASGCLSTMQNTYQAVGLYGNVKAGVQLYHTVDTVKAIKQADPVFQGYDSVKTEAKLSPRDKGLVQEMADAFVDNMAYIVEVNAANSGLNISTCSANIPCEGRTLVMQFEEAGYNANLLQRITVGANLRGTLYYVDKDSGTVIMEDPLELSDNYEGLIARINMSVGTKMLKSAQTEDMDEETLREMVDSFNAVDPVKPEYKMLLAKK